MGCTVTMREPSIYLFCPTPVSFDAAEDGCLSAGYQLAVFDDSEEQDWAVDQSVALRGGAWWFGLTDRDSEGDWSHWITGEPVVFSDWASGEPNDWGAGEDCASYLFSGDKWNDYPCGTLLPYVCEGG